MSEHEAPPVEDTPAPSDTPDVPWQKRYEDLRPEFDRTTAALKDSEAVWEDEQALLARVAEKFPHLMAEEEEDTDNDDFEDDEPTGRAEPKPDPQVQWLVSREAERQYQSDLKEELGDRRFEDPQVEKNVHQWIKDRTMALGANRKALKQAVEEFDAITAGLAPKEPKKKSRVPHVPAGGKASTGVKDFSQMSKSEIDDWMVERAQALEAEM